MRDSLQPNPYPRRLRDFGAFQVDISTLTTQKVVATRDIEQQAYTTVHANGRKRADEQQTKNSKRTSKKLSLVTLLLLLVCFIGSGVAVAGYETYTAQYQSDLSFAQAGITHLETAATLLKALPKNPFDAHTVSQAHGEFVAAAQAFTQLDTGLESLPGISTAIPVYGARLSAALHLAPVASEVSQAGIAGCDALSLLITRLHDPLSSGHGLTMADLTVVEKDLHTIQATLKLAAEQVTALQPGDVQFDARLGKMVATFQHGFPTLQTSIDEAAQVLALAPTLLGIGTPSNYLIEVLDSTELRPGGGFIGNDGIATLAGGRLAAAHITDTYLLDRGFRAAGHSLPYPAAYRWFDLAPGSWSLHDSNLDADFPTAARYAEQIYSREGGKIPVQGVIAITPALIEQALTMTGPIAVPEYHETVTAQNLVERIHYHQVGAGYEGDDIPALDGHSSVRKHFTELLAEHVLARIHQLPATALPRLAQVLISALHSKDLQLYVNAPGAEEVLQRLHLDASIQAPAGDGLLVVDANYAPSKANQYISNTLVDTVTLDAQGNARHQTTLTYAWLSKGDIYGAALYRDYVRVYVPPGSTLQGERGWQSRGTSQAFGRTVWAGFFTLTYGQTRTITLTWTLPGAARKDAQGWHYQSSIQRQAGAQWTLHLEVALPACAVLKQTWGGLQSRKKQVATLNQSLQEDFTAGIDYTCSG